MTRGILKSTIQEVPDINEPGNQALRDIGAFYCTVYSVTAIVGAIAIWQYWHGWALATLVSTLADLVTVAAGVALSATILKEGVHMVLARMMIEQEREKARAEGRKQGREQGRLAEQTAQAERHQAALSKFAVEVDGVRMLPDTEEVRQFLAGNNSK